MLVGLVVLWINGTVALVFSAGLVSNLIVSSIVGVFVIFSIYCGYLNYKAYKRENLYIGDLKKQVNHGWFFASVCSRLGLLGTVWGFIILSKAITLYKVGDIQSMQDMITGMSSGLAVALVTTLVGQICNILLSLQYHMLNQKLERDF